MPDELLPCNRVLTVGQARELLSRDLTGQFPLCGQLAVPFSASPALLAVVALLRIGEFLGMIRPGLAGTEGFRDGKHRLSIRSVGHLIRDTMGAGSYPVVTSGCIGRCGEIGAMQSRYGLTLQDHALALLVFLLEEGSLAVRRSRLDAPHLWLLDLGPFLGLALLTGIATDVCHPPSLNRPLQYPLHEGRLLCG